MWRRARTFQPEKRKRESLRFEQRSGQGENGEGKEIM